MSRQYQAGELLRLRDSPLVCKPAGLLPTEEWMGPLPDVSQRRPANRGKAEDSFTHDASMSRRPAFEPRTIPRGSTTVPEDIVLGPPKTAFASASGARNGSRTLDSSNRTSYGPVGDEAVKNDRYHAKERHTKDAQKADKEGDKSRDTRLGNLHNRKGTKEDNEPWSGARQQKGFSHDDAGNGRNGGRDKDRENGGREPRIQRGFENHRRDVDREGNGDSAARRNAPSRGRFEPSWYRDDDRQEGEPQEGGKDNTKPRDWRDKDRGGFRGPDREWNKAVKPEQDPEWMDEPEPEEKKQAHTQEDFQRWKERMKATSGPLSPTEQRPNHERTLSNLSANAGKGKFETPLIADPQFDGFFGLWSENNKDASKQGVQEQTNNPANKPNAPKPSKFTGFFSPKPVAEVPVPEPEPSQPPLSSEATKDSSNEDKEGFQRILKLLDQQQPNSGKNGLPVREKPPRDAPSSQSAQPPRSRESGGLESLLGSQHPKDAPLPQNRDSEFLLKLMQQTQQARPNINQSNSNNQRLDGGPAPGILPFIISTREPNQVSGTLPPGYINDSAREELQQRDRLNPTAPPERKGVPPGFFGGYPEILPRNSGAGVISQSALSSGLQRPPGLEQAPTVYAQNMQSQRQGMVPPPGFQAPIRAHNPFPPGLMPNISSSNNPNERGPPYGLRHVGPTGPAGMPPPGFMTMNPPAPGFPPAPFNQEGRMSPPGRLYYGPGTQRQAMDGFGEAANTFGMGGQGILPGQYRRQE